MTPVMKSLVAGHESHGFETFRKDVKLNIGQL